MRTIEAKAITEAVAKLCIDANYYLSPDVYDALKTASVEEASPLGREVLGKLIINADIAKAEDVPICQDTGMAVIFAEVGQDAHIVGGNFEEAVNAGVAKGYVDGYLRKSVVTDPVFDRKNTQDNTPAIIHTRIVSGDKINLTMCPKGAGSENKGGIKMLVPADGVEGIKKVVLNFVQTAGGNPCPPMVVGVGIGGTMEMAACLAKKALTRPISQRNEHPDYARLEDELLELLQKTGIGPQGFGGTTTALAVNVEWYPTHIACMPVAVNINCHATRHAHVEL